MAGVDLAYWKDCGGEDMEEYVPMPTRLADLMTHQMRKEYQEEYHKELRKGKILSAMNTATHANSATVSRLFSL